MNEDNGFIREVTEEVQRERFVIFARKYGLLIGACIIAIIAAGSGYTYWQHYQLEQAKAFGAALIAPETMEDVQARKKAYIDLAQEQNGQSRAALAYLKAVAPDAPAPDIQDPLYMDAEILFKMYSQIDTIDGQTALDTLEPLAQDGRPFRLAALELIASVHVRDNDIASAQDVYEQIVMNPETPPGMRARATYMQQIYPKNPENTENPTQPSSSEKEPA